MITACIVLLYISYSIPVVALLIKGRDNIKHGPFWLGKFGLFANYVLLVWTLFTLAMYSIPFTKPVRSDSESFLVEYSPLIPLLTLVWTTLFIPFPSSPLRTPFTHTHPSSLRTFSLPWLSSDPISNTYLFCRHELRLSSLCCCVRLCAHLLGCSGEAYISN